MTPSLCQSAGLCPNRISEVDLQLGRRQCAECQDNGAPLPLPVEISPMEPPKKKTEAIDAEAVKATPGILLPEAAPTSAALEEAQRNGYSLGVAAERARNVGLLKQKSADALMAATNDDEILWATQVMKLALWLEGNGA